MKKTKSTKPVTTIKPTRTKAKLAAPKTTKQSGSSTPISKPKGVKAKPTPPVINQTFNHSLHMNILDKHPQKNELMNVVAQQTTNNKLTSTTDTEISIPLSTISLMDSFDAYINITFSGMLSQQNTTLLVDSGNTCLIIPRYEDIEGLPDYKVLGEGNEPWGSPAMIVQGPILIPTSDGGTFTINDCVFYACTGGPRTANFGTGCISPWNTTVVENVTMQSPLSYNTEYPIAVFNYEAVESIISDSNDLHISNGSVLTLHKELPSGFSLFNIIRDFKWMSLMPNNLWINGVLTGWPGNNYSVAFIDTGGGPINLSDPNGYIYPFALPDSVVCPTWSSTSINCSCTNSPITIQLMDPYYQTFWMYTVDTKKMPASVQGLTLVACETNAYMMNQQGMNIGGISALFMDILIDYQSKAVGFKMK